jgi:signal transduction histidine kinase
LGHDLRYPIAAIDSGMSLLSKTPLDDKAKNIVGMVRRSVIRMTGLVDDVTDFARGRLGGGIALKRSADEPLEPVLRQIVAELQTVAPDRTIEVTLSLTEPDDCDRDRIGRLASNLLNNAMVHSASERPVRVAAETADGWFELSVSNSGEPIPPELLPQIFELYRRGSHRRGQQGAGTRHIANEIARAHGGTLEVQSTGEETRFTFRMPSSNG